VAVADDGVDFGEGGQLLGSALGVAAGDDDAGVGVVAMDAAHESAGLAVGFRGDATGIYNDNIGCGRAVGRVQAAMAQVGGNGLTVRAAGAASKVFNVIFCHVDQCNNR